MKKRYFITGGGTGGHIYPALAVYVELSKLDTFDQKNFDINF